MTEKHEDVLQPVQEELARRNSAGFDGDLIIHFRQGVPLQIETREFIRVENLKKRTGAPHGQE